MCCNIIEFEFNYGNTILACTLEDHNHYNIIVFPKIIAEEIRLKTFVKKIKIVLSILLVCRAQSVLINIKIRSQIPAKAITKTKLVLINMNSTLNFLRTHLKAMSLSHSLLHLLSV